MKSVKMNRVFMLVELLIVMIWAQGLVGTSQEIPPGRTVPELLLTDVKVEISIPFIPKVGEVFEATLTIYCRNDLEPDRLGRPGPDYKVVFEGDVEFINGNEQTIYDHMKKGETRSFKAKMVIKEAKERIGIGGSIVTTKGPHFVQGANIEIFLVNPETGQYGTKEEYDKQLRKQAEWWYDNTGEFTSDPVSPDCAARNREIIVQLKGMESRLTDWEALYLHYDGIQTLMGGMGDGKTTWEARWRFLLDMGWLEKQRAGKAIKDAWLKKLIEHYKGKSLQKEQGFNPGFFRNDSNNSGAAGGNISDSTRAWSVFYFNGWFRYKKHQYNKNQGLLGDAKRDTTKTGETRCT